MPIELFHAKKNIQFILVNLYETSPYDGYWWPIKRKQKTCRFVINGDFPALIENATFTSILFNIHKLNLFAVTVPLQYL